MYFLNFCSSVGQSTIKFVSIIGRFTIFIYHVGCNLFSRPFYYRILLDQCVRIGFFSLLIISMTAFFSGAVLALQTFNGFSRFNASNVIAEVVTLSITRELCPVLVGLMVTSRVGSSIAAEIATMRVTEQIDALFILSTNSIKYLVTPKILASIIVLPLLVLVGDVIGIMGGYIISVFKLQFHAIEYITNTFNILTTSDIVSGMIKSVVFGVIMSTVSCFSGYYAMKGAKGVGKSTTFAVGTASLLILISNYFMTELFFMN
ncbi:MlaE family ABC transporter permease [Rickettsia endosymbiont of Cardiosporidium cionae]|uniref:MlaE family ABC transporter permease n=1 Tax=Rickettsia endosymbiont of Cardiosporidium cionae TaxID=2777155 RepID=UPI00189456F4|nr:ABC transporter permease [Rickettsia endosymbiont of Cardiosporidium cionae]KAF8818120.1 ABC transporter permease [Rickettsia endosymbiont of Cardiosporidium cionae]